MKPLYLSIEGLEGKDKQSFDFTTRVASLAAICNQDTNELKELMALGFYGEGIQGKVELAYEYNGEEYVIKRNFDNNMAELSCRDGNVVCEGSDEVNSQINTHLKLNKKAFDKLVLIDRDNIYENFLQSAEIREQFVGQMLDELVTDKAEISLIKQNLKEKYEKTKMQIEIIEEVSPKDLADLKEEIKDKNVIKQDINNEIIVLHDSINKGKQAQQALDTLEKEITSLQKAQAKSMVIEELEEMLRKSDEAKIVSSLIERKQNIIERDQIFENRIKEIDAQINNDAPQIAKGEKTAKSLEEILIHCLERVKELRQILYTRVEGLNSDEKYCTSIKNKINNIYKQNDEEVVMLKKKKQDIVNELIAIEQSCSDINERIKEMGLNADRKKAIREGAILETEIGKLIENITQTKSAIDECDNRMSTLKTDITKKEKEMAKNKAKLTDLHKMAVDNFKTREEALENAENALTDIHKYSILVTTYEQEVDAIDKKIEENKAGLKEYTEDLEVLNGAKEGLIGYIEKQKKYISSLENKLFHMTIDFNRVKQISELEYGQQCPVCNSVVLNKKDRNFRIDERQKDIDISMQDLSQEKQVLDEYLEKMQQINSRTGELSARIKISQAYISSLNESKMAKNNYIENALQKAGVKNSYKLSQKYNEIKEKVESLKKADENFVILNKEVLFEQATLDFLRNEYKKLEDQELPSIMQRHKNYIARLTECQKEYDSLNKLLNGSTALDKLEEMALLEKEYDTLRNSLSEKKDKIELLQQEKDKVQEMIFILEARKRDINIKGNEYDYQTVIIKIIGESVGELLEELQKSEEEVDQVTTELSAVRKVLNNIKEKNNKNVGELVQISSRLSSDKEILSQIMTDYTGVMLTLRVDNTKDLRKLILTEERIDDIKEEINRYKSEIVLRSNNVERLQQILDENSEFLNQLEENEATVQVLTEKYEELTMKVASITIKRAEMKSRAKQLFALKEKVQKYEEKLKVLGEIVNLINENEDITNYIIKLSSKRLYSLSKGKYNLDTSDGELILLNNSQGGKKVDPARYSREEKMLVSLVLSTALHRTLIDMIGGEPFMLIFPLKEKEANKDIAAALASYAKKKSLMVVADNKNILNELEKIN